MSDKEKDTSLAQIAGMVEELNKKANPKFGLLRDFLNCFKKPQTRQTIKGANIQYQYQKLQERKKLLRILSWLLGIQMVFMNIVVLLIVVWCVFDHKVFRAVDADVLKGILGFTKYYVTAVLVELLSGVLYIVHSVFSEKDSPPEEKR